MSSTGNMNPVPSKGIYVDKSLIAQAMHIVEHERKVQGMAISNAEKQTPAKVAYKAVSQKRSGKEESKNRFATSSYDVNAIFLDTFFAELERCGVVDYIISPGSRSTGLAMKAYERFKNVYVHIDERGAAFFALGLAKAKKRPVAVICTSGTATGNWMPAVLEAESSRVPLLLLSGDRPARLQQVGAPQTCDQVKLFSDHVKRFIQMPEPTTREAVLSYVRQMALEACIAANGCQPGAQSCDAGPVHINFPFDEPLLPSPKVHPDAQNPLPPTIVAGQALYPVDIKGLADTFCHKRTVALCGEGTVNDPNDIPTLLAFAHACNIPLVADPLSGLRAVDDPLVIDAYEGMKADEIPDVDIIVRFGRWPISKTLTTTMAKRRPVQIVVDVRDTRDMNVSTSSLVRTLPVVFAASLSSVTPAKTADAIGCEAWVEANKEATRRLNASLNPLRDDFEGSYVAKVFEAAPQDSLVFSANSMSIRAIDRYYRKSNKNLRILCNRGLNGIDGTLSCALGAAQAYRQTTCITGDLALLHDISAFAFQNELKIRELHGEGIAPSIVIVLLNNNGGAIFDMLPQKSQEEYFPRLFLTPQNVNFKHIAQGFSVPYERAQTVAGFRAAYLEALEEPGITLIEVPLPLAGLTDRYALLK